MESSQPDKWIFRRVAREDYMLIKKLQIKNYKAFRDSGAIEFSSGINVIVGKNNAGKTTLLEALALEIKNNPHLHPTDDNGEVGESSISGSFIVKKDELRNYSPGFYDKLKSEVKGFDFAALTQIKETSQDLKVRSDLILYEAKYKLLNWLNDRASLEINFHVTDNSEKLKQGVVENVNIINEHSRRISTDFTFNESLSSKDELELFYIFTAIKPSLNDYFLNLFRKRVYRFRAERFVSGNCLTGNDNISALKSDASNLAGAISLIQGRKPGLFEVFNEYVSYIFPEIRKVSVYPKEPSSLEILVWFDGFQRDTSPFILENCGSGLGQVLAILCVVLTSEEPSYIIIDEPQSFLHPGAAKDLMDVLQSFPQHQYFISTHSPSIIKAANPSTIVMLYRQNFETLPRVLDKSSLTDSRAMLSDIGFKLSDVFGADKILWVEGPTEAECFPKILRFLGKKLLRGIEILPIVATGDLEKKRSTAIFEIYEKLSTGKSIIPPSLVFILDNENRDEDNKKDLEKRANNLNRRIYFLERCMYENYILHSESIAAILNEDDIGLSNPLDASEVSAWIKENRGRYCMNQNQQNQPDEWIKVVNAAKLLEECFEELSEERVEFRKTRHSVKITDWIIEHEPDFLSPLTDFLLKVMDDLEAVK